LDPRTLQTCQNSFPNSFPLELRNCAKDVHLEFARRCRSVDALRQTHKRHAKRLQFIEAA
jgi:hypothetical protein